MSINTVIFDLDDTLLWDKQSIQSAFGGDSEEVGRSTQCEVTLRTVFSGICVHRLCLGFETTICKYTLHV